MAVVKPSMPIGSKLMLGLLGFSAVPLVALGWFICAQVNKARVAAVMQVQVAGQKSVEELRNLGRQAAQYKAEEIAREVALFFRENPGADVTDLRSVESVRRAAGKQTAIGCVTTIEVLFRDRPVDLSRPGLELPSAEPRLGPADRGFEVAAAALNAPGRAVARPGRAYTYVANVAGTPVKIAATVEDVGIGRPIEQLARVMEGIGRSAEEETSRAVDRLKLMMVLGVAALVAVLAVAGGQVARSITRPIARLTTAAEHIRKGERDVDLDVGGGKELQLLAAAFKRTTTELQDYGRSLEAKNLELDVARRLAEKATRELQDAQDEMIQMEKMSSLGRLVAGVAHEINTPTGAIYNVTAEAVETLDALVGGLHRMREMTVDEFGVFRHYLDVAVARRLMPERVSRKERHELCLELEKAGVGDAKKYAELLCRCHITAPREAVETCQLLEKYGAVGVFTALVEIHASMKITRTSAEKISQIVRALKFYSHGGEQMAPTPTDINQTIRDALVILHNRLKNRVDLELSLAEGLPEVRCTSGLTEVWVNLLTNACDAIEERTPNGRGVIRIQSVQTGGLIRVAVADNGQPIPPGIASKIFDPFFTTKPPGKGTGLGLSVVMGTVKRNGGAVTLKSEGEFKEFEVTLPVESAGHVGAS